MPIPVYLFTGFLESGKTKFIQETFEDSRFEDGLRALLLVCEEGEEEYDPSRFAVKNYRVEYGSSAEELTRSRLEQITADFKPEKIVVECNGMWPLGRLYEALPEEWTVYQQMLFFDGSTFAAYNESNPDCKATATIFFNSGLVDESSTHHLLTAHILGMELGNHTHSHLDLTTLSPAELKSEIDKTDELLSRIDGKPRHLFRAPYGRIDEEVKAQVETPIIDWTIDTLDWTNASEDEIYERVWNNRFSGGIVLMHDGYPHTVYALKRLLPDLKADGYQVVSVSAMAKAHGCALRRGGVYIRARKQ